MSDTYETHAKGIRILPGQWRPHYPFEQIAWVSPPWPSQDYVWLDFPEAIFSDAGLLYLSHVNPRHPVLFPGLAEVPWQQTEQGIGFERRLPNGVRFGGTVRTGDEATVALMVFIFNGSEKPLREIKLQTCAYLRGIKEFAEHTMGNKYVHVSGKGWVAFESARGCTPPNGRYCLGWRNGPPVADLPVIVTLSAETKRIVAMTWHGSTHSLVGNPSHPCMHADPCFPDLSPGQEARINGELIFFEGALRVFEDWFAGRYKEGQQGAPADADKPLH